MGQPSCSAKVGRLAQRLQLCSLSPDVEIHNPEPQIFTYPRLAKRHISQLVKGLAQGPKSVSLATLEFEPPTFHSVTHWLTPSLHHWFSSIY